MISVGILLPWEVFCFVWGCFCPDDDFGSCQTSTWTSQLHSCSPTFLRRNTKSIPPPHGQRERALCPEQRSQAFLIANTYSYNHPKEKTCWWQVFSFFCSFHGEEHCFLPEFWFWFFSFFFFVLWKRHHHVKGIKLLLNPDDGGRMAFCCSFFCKASSWSCVPSRWQYIALRLVALCTLTWLSVASLPHTAQSCTTEQIT